jgi:hypothetical protein
MKARYMLLFAVLFTALSSHAQKDPIKWGKVPDEDLKMTSYEADPDAEAVVLCNFGSLKFNFGPSGAQYFLTVHKRIKVLKRSGFDVADVEIPYYHTNHINRLKAMVINPDGSEYEVDKDNIFDGKITDKYSSVKFAFPNVQEGSVLEYRYEMEADDLFSLEDWSFQEDYPTRWSELRTEMIEYFKYVKWFSGDGVLSVQDCGTSTRPYGSGSYVVDECRYVAENLPGLKPEAFISTMEDYYFKIRFQLQSIEIPGQLYENILTSWDQAVSELMSSDNFGDQFLLKGNYSKIADATAELATTGTETEKAQKFARWIHQNIEESVRYNGVYSRDRLNKAFENRKGTASERNMILLALLKENNISAYPVLVSSQNNGKPITQYPILTQFDHMMIFAELDGKGQFLDITNAWLPVNMPHPESMNEAGFLIGKESSGWVQLNPLAHSNKLLFSINLHQDGSLDGNLTTSHEGYAAYNERLRCTKEKDGSYWKTRLQEAHPDAVAENFKNENHEAISEDFKTSLDFKIQEGATAAGNMIYFSPILYSSFSENKLKIEKRLYPVELGFPLKEQEVINLNIPEGYTVESVPESVNLALPNKGGTFKYMVNPKANSIQIISKVELNQVKFLPEEYAGLRNFMEIIVQKMGEQVVLKKA